jgi:glycosyl transferase family 87
VTVLPTRRDPVSALVLLALGASAIAVLRWSALGDYPNDAGPALSGLAKGHLHAFLAARPAMGSLSLFVRAPFVALASAASASPLEVYRAGALPCVASLGLLAAWLARVAGARGTRGLGQVTIVLVAILNPLVRGALASGHPEELMTAGLCVGALVAACQGRASLTAVLLGLALCCKQWSVVAVLPVLLSLERRRLRALARATLVAAACTLPMLVASPGDFLANQLQLAHQRYLEPALNSWLWLLAPSVTKHLHVAGQPVTVHVARLTPTLVGLLHPLIIAIAIGLALAVWRRARGPIPPAEVFALTALIFVLRCALDTETMPYYHVALMLTVLAWEALRGGPLPARSLGGAVIAYLLFDVLEQRTSPRVGGMLYALCSIGVALWLIHALLARRAPGDRRVVLAGPAAMRAPFVAP